jgi:hypothetical protein
MSGQGVAWPNVLADLEIKRDALNTMIEIVRTHFCGDTPGEMPDSTAAQSRGARPNYQQQKKTKDRESHAEPFRRGWPGRRDRGDAEEARRRHEPWRAGQGDASHDRESALSRQDARARETSRCHRDDHVASREPAWEKPGEGGALNPPSSVQRRRWCSVPPPPVCGQPVSSW